MTKKTDHQLEEIKTRFSTDTELINLIRLYESEETHNEAMAIIEPVIERAEELTGENGYKPKKDIYYIVKGTGEDVDDYEEDESMESYCEECIERAVDKKREEYHKGRNEAMGKIYEATAKGFYREVRNKWDENTHEYKGNCVKKIKVTPEQVEYLKLELKENYPAKMKWDYRYVNGNESEGFECCEGCGEIFCQSLLLREQEMAHWIYDCKDFDFSDREKYQLNAVLYWDFAEDGKKGGFKIGQYIVAKRWLQQWDARKVKYPCGSVKVGDQITVIKK